MLLAVAEVLHKSRATMRGSVKLIFQPAEEFGGGVSSQLLSHLLSRHLAQLSSSLAGEPLGQPFCQSVARRLATAKSNIAQTHFNCFGPMGCTVNDSAI